MFSAWRGVNSGAEILSDRLLPERREPRMISTAIQRMNEMNGRQRCHHGAVTGEESREVEPVNSLNANK
jgi:hypothetical protein